MRLAGKGLRMRCNYSAWLCCGSKLIKMSPLITTEILPGQQVVL